MYESNVLFFERFFSKKKKTFQWQCHFSAPSSRTLARIVQSTIDVNCAQNRPIGICRRASVRVGPIQHKRPNHISRIHLKLFVVVCRAVLRKAKRAKHRLVIVSNLGLIFEFWRRRPILSSQDRKRLQSRLTWTQQSCVECHCLPKHFSQPFIIGMKFNL